MFSMASTNRTVTIALRYQRISVLIKEENYTMIIRITKLTKPDGGDLSEWAIIELQGDLESRSNQSLSDQFIGDLHFTKSGIPILIVGHHILHGQEASLDKPFVVLEKSRFSESDEPVSKDSLRSESCTKYIIKAIVKKKLVFRVRPKPIIASVSDMI